MNPGLVLILALVAGHVVFLFVAIGIRHVNGVTVHPVTLPAMATRTPPQTVPGLTPVADIALAAVPADHAQHFLTIDRMPDGCVSVFVPPYSEVDIAQNGEWRLYGVFYSSTNINLEPSAEQLFFRARPLRP